MSDTLLNEELVCLLENSDFENFLEKIGKIYPSNNNWITKILKRNAKYERKGEFAYKLIKLVIIDDRVQINREFNKLDLLSNYCFEVIELVRILLRLENHHELAIIVKKLAIYIKLVFKKLSEHISIESNDYPNNSISPKIWMDGEILREWAQVVSQYFNRKEMLKEEIDMCFYKSKITLSIMGHYPEEVGPDMIAVESKLEKFNHKEKATKFYKPVISDFAHFLVDIESYCNEKDFILEIREEKILNSLIQAVKGLQRIDQYLDDHNYIERSKLILNKKTV